MLSIAAAKQNPYIPPHMVTDLSLVLTASSNEAYGLGSLPRSDPLDEGKKGGGVGAQTTTLAQHSRQTPQEARPSASLQQR